MIVISSIRKLCKFIEGMEESKVDHKHFPAEGGLRVFRGEHIRCGVKSTQDLNRKVPETSNLKPFAGRHVDLNTHFCSYIPGLNLAGFEHLIQISD